MTYTELLGWGGRDEFAIYLSHHTIVHPKEQVWMETLLNYKRTKTLTLCMCLLLLLLLLFNNKQSSAIRGFYA